MARIPEERLLNFTHGLTGVQRLPDAAPLPTAGSTPAVDTRPVIHLEALFDRPGFADMLDEATAPPVPDPGVLEPSAFAAALEDARASMLQLASARGGPEGAVFAGALAVLDDAHESRVMLESARRALMRG